MSTVEVNPMRTGVVTDDAPFQHDRTAGEAFVRKAGPVYQDARGFYVITSASAVQYVLQHPKVFSSREAMAALHGLSFDLVPLAIDPPMHVKYRRILDPLFSPRTLAPLEAELGRQADELVEAFADRGHCDAMAELAELYPTQVFLTLFGLPLEDRDRCSAWVRQINDNTHQGGLDDNEGSRLLREAADGLTAYLRDAIKQKRADLGDDVLSHVLRIEGEGAWSDDEITGFAWLFTLAGLDTVTSSMGFVLHYFATHPDARRRCIEDPSLINPTVEEILRLEAVSPFVPRVSLEDAVVDGYAIPAGSFISVGLGPANRDPQRFSDPNEMDLTRADPGHFTFGGGIHRCVGSHLARRELRLVVDAMLRRIPEFQVAQGASCLVKWPTGITCFEHLPLTWDV